MIVPTETVKVVCRMTDINGGAIQNRYFLQNGGAGPATDEDFLDAAEVQASAWMALIEAELPDTLTPVDIACDIVDWVGGELVTQRTVGIIPWTTWGGGTASSDGLPQGCAAVVNFPTSWSGIQGRKYIGPLTEARQNNGVLDATALAALTAYAALVLLGFTVDDDWFNMGTMSSKRSDFVGFASSIIKAVIGYQRRRKAGVGS